MFVDYCRYGEVNWRTPFSPVDKIQNTEAVAGAFESFNLIFRNQGLKTSFNDGHKRSPQYLALRAAADTTLQSYKLNLGFLSRCELFIR